MADLPAANQCPAVISSLSYYALAGKVDAYGGSLATSVAVWPTANLGIFVPFALPGPFTLRALFSVNGSVAGNIDLGVYDAGGVLLVAKGSTAMSGATVPQILTVTERLLPAGRYYMAMACSSTSASFVKITPSVVAQQSGGVAQAATQIPLAASPTLATPANTYVPLFGIASITTF